MNKNIISLECPNCGAPFKGFVCEYCGSALREVWSGYEGENLFINAASTSVDISSIRPGTVWKLPKPMTPSTTWR